MLFRSSFPPYQINKWLEIYSQRLINPVFRTFQTELESVYEEYNMYKDNPSVRILLIARNETEEQVTAYFREHQYDMKFFADPDRNVYSLFADSTIPRVFLADKSGTIILTQTEKVDAEEIMKITT